jgi:hypothetical protein
VAPQQLVRRTRDDFVDVELNHAARAASVNALSPEFRAARARADGV